MKSPVKPLEHSRFGTVEPPKIDKIGESVSEKEQLFEKEQLPLTLPLIKFCLADDVNQTGQFEEDFFVSLL